MFPKNPVFYNKKMTENFGGKDDARYIENHGIEKPGISIFYCNVL